MTVTASTLPLEATAKHITDLEQLVRLLTRGLPRSKPWQRQLSAHLAEVDAQLQIFRLTVSLDRSSTEIIAAASHVAAACSLAVTALAGSRIDRTTRTALHLVVDLANRIHSSLAHAR